MGLLKGRVGPRGLTLKIRVSQKIWACGSGVKSVLVKYECSPNLVSIEHRVDALRHRMIVCQNDIYSKSIDNASKCTVVGGMVSALRHFWALWAKRAIM